MGWTTPSSWGNPRQKVGVLNKYKLLSIIVSTSKYLRASDNISTYLPCSDCFVAGVKARLPILGWLPHYNLNDAVSDAIAGVTVGLTVIPQGDVIIPSSLC